MTELPSSLSLGCRGALPLVGVAHSTIRAAVSSVCPAGRALPGSWDRTRGRPGGPRDAPGAHFLGYLITLPFGTKLFSDFFAFWDKTRRDKLFPRDKTFRIPSRFLPKRAKSGILGPPGPLIPPRVPLSGTIFRDFSRNWPKWPFLGFSLWYTVFSPELPKSAISGPRRGSRRGPRAVSYTHLTLPTILRV